MQAIRLLCVILPIAFFTTSLAWAHPVDGYAPKPAPRGYGTEGYGLAPECSIGDITFTRSFPDPSTLSSEELYILSGSTNSAFGHPLKPWRQQIRRLVQALHENLGYIPDRLTEELVRSVVCESSQVDDLWVEQFKNPLTGEFPRLDASEFSPGDLYIRALSEQEKQHIASLIDVYYSIWYDSAWFNPAEEMWENAELSGDVYYVRIYGWNGVLVEGIEFLTVGDDEVASARLGL